MILLLGSGLVLTSHLEASDDLFEQDEGLTVRGGGDGRKCSVLFPIEAKELVKFSLFVEGHQNFVLLPREEDLERRAIGEDGVALINLLFELFLEFGV